MPYVVALHNYSTSNISLDKGLCWPSVPHFCTNYAVARNSGAYAMYTLLIATQAESLSTCYI